MSLEWFDRVTGELQDHLESICEKYDQAGHMTIERSSKHPRIEFFVETDDEDGREYFFTLFFDPHNEEFYSESYDIELDQPTRIILSDIDDIVDAVHVTFHEYMNEDEDEEMDETYIEDDIEDEYFQGEVVYSDDDIFEEIDVEWETPEVTAFMKENEVEVTYQFGLIQETGDGVLRRINRLWTEDDEMIRDETNFIFTKEEAGTIIALIASHMNTMKGYDI